MTGRRRRALTCIKAAWRACGIVRAMSLMLPERPSGEGAARREAGAVFIDHGDPGIKGTCETGLDSPNDFALKKEWLRLPVLAQLRSADRVQKFLLFGVDRTYRGHYETDAVDPIETFVDASAAAAYEGRAKIRAAASMAF